MWTTRGDKASQLEETEVRHYATQLGQDPVHWYDEREIENGNKRGKKREGGEGRGGRGRKGREGKEGEGGEGRERNGRKSGKEKWERNGEGKKGEKEGMIRTVSCVHKLTLFWEQDYTQALQQRQHNK